MQSLSSLYFLWQLFHPDQGLAGWGRLTVQCRLQRLKHQLLAPAVKVAPGIWCACQQPERRTALLSWGSGPFYFPRVPSLCFWGFLFLDWPCCALLRAQGQKAHGFCHIA